MRCRNLFIALLLLSCPRWSCATGDAADLLVTMHGRGTVERFDGATGRHVATFIRGVDRPNALAFGPDGDLYIGTGATGSAGEVQRFDAESGRFLGTFISVPPGQPGYLARASHLVWHSDELFVVSCDDSRVQCYDGKTGAFQATLATGNPGGWITQIAVCEGALYAMEFSEARVERFPLNGGASSVLVAEPGFSPWGIVFDASGRCWWSGSGGVVCFAGTANSVLLPSSEVATPIALAMLPEGHLVCSSLGKQNVTLWDLSGTSPRLIQTISGPL